MLYEVITNSSPKLPDDVTRPMLNLSLYPASVNAGYSNAPSATMVTPDAPVKAVKNAQATKATMARPPGIHPRKARVSLTRR